MWLIVDLNTKTFTIYNTVPGTRTSTPLYGWRFTVNKCNAHKGYKRRVGNNAETIDNATTFFCKDYSHYLEPSVYYALSEADRANHFTLAPNDFIVFDDVNTEIEHLSVSEWQELKETYKHKGMVVSEAFAYINGLITDHLEAVSL